MQNYQNGQMSTQRKSTLSGVMRFSGGYKQLAREYRAAEAELKEDRYSGGKMLGEYDRKRLQMFIKQTDDFVDSCAPMDRYILRRKLIYGWSNLRIAMSLGYSDETVVRRKLSGLVTRS